MNKDFTKLNLNITSEKISLVIHSDFGYPIAIQLKLEEIKLKNYAHYENCIYVIGTPKRKRTKMGYLIRPNQDFKIFEGWVVVNETSSVTEKDGVKITSLGLCFDKDTLKRATNIDAKELISSYSI
jgi:hypothetical protein